MEITTIIIYILIALIILTYIIWQLLKNGLRQTCINLIVRAEETLKDNQEKFNSVVAGVILRLPFPLNLIPTNLVESFVQKVFDEVKIALDYQKGDKYRYLL